MKKSQIPLFIVALLLPYVMAAVDLLFYSYGSNLMMFMIMMQIASVILFCLAVDKKIPLMILTANLCACTCAANAFQTKLYMKYISADSETELVGNLVSVAGLFFVIGLTVAVFFFVKLMKKAFKYEPVADQAALLSADKRALAPLSVLSMVFTVAAVVFSVLASFFLAQYNFDVFGHPANVFDSFIILVILFFAALIAIALGISFSFAAASKKDVTPADALLALNARIAGLAFLFSIVASVVIIISILSPLTVLGV